MAIAEDIEGAEQESGRRLETPCSARRRLTFASIFGSLLFVSSLVVLIAYELHGLDAVKAVWSARDSINSVNCKPDSTNDGRLVYATCALSNYSLFWDFAGLRRLPPSDLTGIRLVRHAEVYEWHEDYTVTTRTDYVNGGLNTQKHYTYSKIWSEEFENSEAFVKPITCALTQNDGSPCVNKDPSEQPWWVHGPDKLSLGRLEMGKATGIRFGEFELPIEFVNQVGQARALLPKCDFPLAPSDWHWSSENRTEVGGLSAHGPRRGAGNAHSRRSKAGEESETEWCDFLVEGQQSVRVEGEYIYYLNLVNRSVAFTDDFPGDVRVRYNIHTTDSATVLAQQIHPATFGPWAIYDQYQPSKDSKPSQGARLMSTLFVIQDGWVGADALIEETLDSDEYIKWFVRAATALTAFLGMVMVFCVRNLPRHLDPSGGRPSASLFSFVIAAGVLSLWVILEGFLWFVLRPTLGLPLVGLGLVPISLAALVYCQVSADHAGLRRQGEAGSGDAGFRLGWMDGGDRRAGLFNWFARSRSRSLAEPLLLDGSQAGADEQQQQQQHPLFKGVPRRGQEEPAPGTAGGQRDRPAREEMVPRAREDGVGADGIGGL